jgi:hypothetical protein
MCEYLLAVESPWLCDYIESLDHQTGLPKETANIQQPQTTTKTSQTTTQSITAEAAKSHFTTKSTTTKDADSTVDENKKPKVLEQKNLP